MPVKQEVSLIKKKKVSKWKDIWTLLDIPPSKRTAKENKRVKVYLKGLKRLNDIPQEACKNCGKKWPAPSTFCGSVCKEKYEEKNNGKKERQITKDEHKRVKKTLFKTQSN